MRNLMLIIPLICLVSACSESKFSGEQGKKITDFAPAESSDATECLEPAETLVTSETDTIRNNAPEQFVSYQIGLSGCDISILKDTFIKADINAEISKFNKPLPYKIKTIDGELLASGELETILGQDLFGNSGSNYAYWKTDEIDLNLENGNIIFELDYSNIQIRSFEDNRPGEDFEVDTYFAISGAKAITIPMTVIESR